MNDQKKFWRLENAVESSGATLYLDGPIASESWWGDEVTPQAFREELKNISSNKITVVINSGGGDVWAGVAIHDALKELDAEVTVRVSGLAASIASVIAMAGDVIEMTPGSTMMIHKASMIQWGSTEDFKKAIEMLETVEDGIISIYADRTGLSRDVVKDMVESETWMSAEKAVELGFADKVVKPESTDEELIPVENTITGQLSIVMSANQTSMKDYMDKVAASEHEEPTDETPEEPEETPEEPEALEVTTDAEEEETPAPEDELTNDKGIEMTEAEKAAQIAKDQILPENQAPAVPKVSVKDYLKTDASVEAFARVLEAQAGKTSEDVRMAWKEHLAVEMGVTNPEVFLPAALITEIEDAFKKGGEIWNRVTKTGLDVFQANWDSVTGEDSRAKGYNRDEEEEKAEELITIQGRTLRPQFIYKYITLNKEDIKNQRSTGALVRYVLSELPRRIVREVERAIVIGDGRTPGSDFAIASYVSIKSDAVAENVFAETYTVAEDETRYAALLRAKDLLDTDGTPVLISKKGYLTELLLEENVNGGFLFAPGTNLAALLGFDASIEPDWMDEDTAYDAYIVVLQNYKTVGDDSIEAFTNFTLKTNKQEYLQEIWSGGGLTKRKSAVGITAVSES